jgi:hypothetical protein
MLRFVAGLRHHQFGAASPSGIRLPYKFDA